MFHIKGYFWGILIDMNQKKMLTIKKTFLLKKTWQITVAVYGVMGFIGLLAPLNEILPNKWSFGVKAFLSLLMLLSVFFVAGLLVFIWMSKNNKHRVFSVQKGKTLYVQYGDLFSKEIIVDKEGKPSADKRIIIIPVNCCFDTIVDDDLIAKEKIHGQAVQKLLSIMTIEELDKEIKRQLAGKEYTQLEISDKRKGNRKRYDFGTVVEIDSINDSKYFLIALTEFNKKLHMTIRNRENYLVVVQRMIEHISERSQGLPVIIPILGGGVSEVSMSEQEILDTLIQLFRLNKDKINCNIHIVVRNEARDRINIFNY